VWLSKGNIIMDGPTAEVCEKYKLTAGQAAE
jgi:ABC-type polysaccharide/polyol phosphate transport system ATPase subunit